MRSSAEKDFAKWLRKNKVRYKYEGDRLKYVSDYKPDFTLVKKDGSKMFIEVKGWFRGSDRTKTLKVLRENPNIDLRLMFQKNNPLVNKRSKDDYSDWAEKHNIPYTIGLKLPLEWLKELKTPKAQFSKKTPEGKLIAERP